MASIFRERGRWRAQIRRHGRSASKTFTRYDDAARWARKAEAEIDLKAAEKPVLPSKRHKMPTLAEALDRYAAEVAPTLKGADRVLHRVEAWKRAPLARMPLDQITSMHLAEWRDRRKRLAPSTIGNCLTVVSQIFELACASRRNAHRRWHRAATSRGDGRSTPVPVCRRGELGVRNGPANSQGRAEVRRGRDGHQSASFRG